jgi:hypothetical protein
MAIGSYPIVSCSAVSLQVHITVSPNLESLWRANRPPLAAAQGLKRSNRQFLHMLHDNFVYSRGILH